MTIKQQQAIAKKISTLVREMEDIVKSEDHGVARNVLNGTIDCFKLHLRYYTPMSK